jgi:hypothetical protein
MATLAQVRQSEVVAYTTAANAATAELAAATRAATLAGTAVTQIEGQLRTTTESIASKRRQLAEATNPVAAAALNNEIRDLLIQGRAQTGALLDARDAQAEAAAVETGARGRSDRAAAGKAAAEAALKEETAAAAKRQAQLAALGAAPLNGLPAAATAALAGPPGTEADQLIQANFPAELLALVGERFTSRRSALQASAKSVSDARDAGESEAIISRGVLGTVEIRERGFERARTNVEDFVGRAKTRFDGAMAVLGNLQRIRQERLAGQPTPDVLSDPEKVSIATDANRTAAATAAGPVETQRRAITTAQTALDQEILARVGGASIDTFPSSAQVAARRAAVAAARTTLSNTIAGLAEKPTLDLWEIMAPDAAWQLVSDYLDAKATLTDIGGTTLTGANSLTSRLTDAEDAYAAALVAAGRARRRAGALADTLAEREARREGLAGGATLRYVSAIRGDSC